MKKYPKSFLDKLNAVTAKRPKTVIQHILEHGFVTTEELEQLYGYKHAPRAARDVRELGIPLEMYRVKSSDGRSIGAYRLGDPPSAENAVSKTAGRTADGLPESDHEIYPSCRSWDDHPHCFFQNRLRLSEQRIQSSACAGRENGT